MLDHAFESCGEAAERETTDQQWEHTSSEHYRGDDRAERDPFPYSTFTEGPAGGPKRPTARASTTPPPQAVQPRASVKHTPAVPPAAPGRASHAATAGGKQHHHRPKEQAA